MKGFVSFLIGAVVGAATALVYAKRKFQRIADEEIASVKEFYAEKEAHTDVSKSEPVAESAEKDEEYKKYEEAIKMYADAAYGKPCDAEIIDPSECDQEPVRVTYTYYSDGILADDEDDIVEDVEEILGSEWKKVLMYSPCVYVRNKARHTAYEIVADDSPYIETPSEG